MSRDLLIGAGAAVVLHAAALPILSAFAASPPRAAVSRAPVMTVALAAAPRPRVDVAEPAASTLAAPLPQLERAMPPVRGLASTRTPPAGVAIDMPAPVPSAATPLTAARTGDVGAPRPDLPAPRVPPSEPPSALPGGVPAPGPPAPVTNASGRRGPSATHEPPPAYPSIARRRGWQGIVDLRVEVLASGRCGDVEIDASSGYGVLDRAAVGAVKRWRFDPGTIGGRPAAMWIEVSVEFRLED